MNDCLLKQFDINKIEIPKKINENNLLITTEILKTWNLKNIQHILKVYPLLLFNSILLKDDYYDSMFRYNDDNIIFVTNYSKFISHKKNINSEKNYVLIFADLTSHIRESNTKYKKFIKINIYTIYKEIEKLLSNKRLELDCTFRCNDFNINKYIKELKILCKNIYNNLDEIKKILSIINEQYISKLYIENINYVNNTTLINYIILMYYYQNDEIFYVKNNNFYIDPYLLFYLAILNFIV